MNRETERRVTELAVTYWNDHYVASAPNPVQIGVPQLGEFARLVEDVLREAIAQNVRDLVDDMGDPGSGWRAGVMSAARVVERAS